MFATNSYTTLHTNYTNISNFVIIFQVDAEMSEIFVDFVKGKIP